MGSAGFGWGDLGPALSTGGRLSLKACEQFVGARGASRSVSRDLPVKPERSWGAAGPRCFLEVGWSKTRWVPTLLRAGVFCQPHPMSLLGAGVCKLRGKNSQACGVCFPAHQYGPELENRSNWGPKLGSVTVWPLQNLSSVWPKKDNPVEVPGQVAVRLR